MADFLTTKGTASHIEDIIKDATFKLVLISPYLKVSESFLSRLKAASARSVAITIIYRENELKKEQYDMLAGIPYVELRSLKSLHAKCYHNEKEMVLSSMNMYEYSENHNVEMGILITKEQDTILFEKALAECNHIIGISEPDKRNTPKKKVHEKLKVVPNNTNASQNYEGTCIRCGTDIDFNPNKPFCNKCYTSWNEWGNRDFEETFCHNCGDDTDETSMNLPQCPACYKSWKTKGGGNQRKFG